MCRGGRVWQHCRPRLFDEDENRPRPINWHWLGLFRIFLTLSRAPHSFTTTLFYLLIFRYLVLVVFNGIVLRPMPTIDTWASPLARTRTRTNELINQIFIKTLTGRKQAFNFEPENQVLAVKQALQEKEGIQVDQIRLIFSGKQLSDDRTLESYAINAGATIHMVLQLRGGADLVGN